MSATTIEWTDETHNPGIYGCSHYGKGCTHCYAERMARRLASMPVRPYIGVTEGGRWTGEVRIAPVEQAVESILQLPRRRAHGRPVRTFVTSMGDILHESIPVDWTARVIAAMDQRQDRIFQVLTHRGQRWPEVAARVVEILGYWPENAWAGVSVSTQAEADREIPGLLRVPAVVRFLSVEPMLGAVSLRQAEINASDAIDPEWRDGRRGHPIVDVLGCGCCGQGPRIHWVICGGESGPKARPMHPDWARSLRDQCLAAAVPFFFKQWGEWLPQGQRPADESAPIRDQARIDFTADLYVDRIGKKAAGRLLDGRTWDEMPEVAGA